MPLAREVATHAVVLPLYQQQQGHPVGFGQECFAALSTLCGDRGAAAVVRAHRQAGTARMLHLNDPGIVTDIDTLDDLTRAEKLLATGNY